MTVPLLSRLLLIRPTVIADHLERVRRSGLVAEVPNAWQLTLGVLRMFHRMATRPETIGLSRAQPIRRSWLARAVAPRPLRFLPALVAGAVRPWDLTGLLTEPRGMIRHLVGAHHDRHQFAYDLMILSAWPGALERALDEARRVGAGATARDRALRDLCVYEGYHDTLIAAIERARAGDFLLDEDEARSPDVSFVAYLAWCRAQPATPAETLAAWRAGRLDLGGPAAIEPDRR
ncbi:MAG: hypothetical protein IT385_10940 [Deltaproteobacteria bacterium]|nr:hypothetical protein [Deltaproteobacteria bacterium]